MASSDEEVSLDKVIVTS